MGSARMSRSGPTFFSSTSVSTSISVAIVDRSPAEALELYADLEAVAAAGGFLEAFYCFNERLHSHVGFGIDDPQNGDVAIDSRHV